MATTIKLKNGSGAPLAGDLVQGEPALDLTNKRLYTEDSGGTVIEVGTNPTSVTTGTFTSTGIDDNATSTAITIDSSENVGIGTASPSSTAGWGTLLEVSGTANAGIKLTETDTANGDFSLGVTAGTLRIWDEAASAWRLTLDGSGNVGIGNASPTTKLQVTGTGSILRVSDDTSTSGTIELSASSTVAKIHANTYSAAVPLAFEIASSEKMRIDSSGNLLVGTTTQPNGSADGIKLNAASSGRVFSGGTTGGFNQLLFFNPNGQVGSISTSGSTTSYTTSSDERLKENVTDAPAGNIDSIKVRSFDWKADGSHQTYGMVAQELVDVAPEAVSQGENEDDMWGVDYSKLVPMMIKEIQDLKAEVAALKGE